MGVSCWRLGTMTWRYQHVLKNRAFGLQRQSKMQRSEKCKKLTQPSMLPKSTPTVWIARLQSSQGQIQQQIERMCLRLKKKKHPWLVWRQLQGVWETGWTAFAAWNTSSWHEKPCSWNPRIWKKKEEKDLEVRLHNTRTLPLKAVGLLLQTKQQLHPYNDYSVPQNLQTHPERFLCLTSAWPQQSRNHQKPSVSNGW